MKYTIEFDSFPEMLQKLEQDGVEEAYYRGRMKFDDKGNYFPYVEVTAILRVGEHDTVQYNFTEMLSAPANFAKLEHETDEALAKRKNEFTKAWNDALDAKYVRGLQGVKGLKIRMGAIGVTA